ncbi:Brix domain [Carpediemonas membranifera]|uniref:Brix domain n=1 Tax=Carpediemonas membranifera TaxID=201153 RepID=A0A8J6B073_9EUKA|nr:Brix domain [Carpediemonas membranifera]|eukprot:KAG9395610.1 Brix domain [Carpediemonas membranifera]
MYRKRKYVKMQQDYLYRKSKESSQQEETDKRNKIVSALKEGKAIPTELRRDAYQLAKDAEFDDVISSEIVQNHLDDEYQEVGIREPRILITTSHNASGPLKTFVKELKLMIPNAEKVNRGKETMRDVIENARDNFTDVILVHEHGGKPDTMIISHLPYGPTAYFSLENVVLRSQVLAALERRNPGASKKPTSGAAPHLIFDGFSTLLGQRLRMILKHIFPVPKVASRRVVTFANENNHIVFRNHIYTRGKNDEVELEELGPRFDMRPFRIQAGTYNEKATDDEWALRGFMNKSRVDL